MTQDRPATSPPPAIFFDISTLVRFLGRSPQLSGIQRVVVMLIAEAARIYPPGRTYVAFEHRGTYRALPVSKLGNAFPTRHEALAPLFARRSRVPVPPLLQRYGKNRVVRGYHRLRFDLAALRGRSKTFERYGTSLADWRAYQARRRAKGGTALRQARPFGDLAKANDHLIVLDGSWKERNIKAFRAAHADGVHVTSFVHDMIPVLMPHTTVQDMPHRFHNWLVKSLDYTATYVANSQSTLTDLRRFLDARAATQPSVAVPLAQQSLEAPHIAQSNAAHSATFPWLAETIDLPDRIRAVATTPFVICVGTIEIRKNSWALAQAWHRMAQQPDLDIPRLIFAGRRGWLSQSFDDFMQATGSAGGFIQVVQAPTDAELQFLYRHCQFAAMPSLYEGWGLPVGEALAYGKTAVVADVSSLPEVGGDLVEYCDPHSIASIQAACTRLIADPDHRRALEARIAQANLRTWSDVAQDLLKAVGAAPEA